MAKDKKIIGVKFDPEDRKRIEREAEKDGGRSLSSLIRSIVLPEIKRRERKRQERSNSNLAPAA